jgi:hypothetical protein
MVAQVDDGGMTAILFLIGFVAVAALSIWFGADSRPYEPRHRPNL